MHACVCGHTELLNRCVSKAMCINVCVCVCVMFTILSYKHVYIYTYDRILNMDVCAYKYVYICINMCVCVMFTILSHKHVYIYTYDRILNMDGWASYALLEEALRLERLHSHWPVTKRSDIMFFSQVWYT